MIRRIAVALLLAAAPLPAVAQQDSTAMPAQPAPLPALEQRIAELPAALRGEIAYETYFAPGFVAQIPKPSFDMLLQQIGAEVGAPTAIQSVTPRSATQATLQLGFERGSATVAIEVEAAAPHRVSALLIQGVLPDVASFDAAVDTLKALPGTTGFLLARLGEGAPEPLRAHNARAPLAIGSVFKLVILAELVRATNAGERKWSDEVALPGKPLPGGRYTAAPAGTKVTLRELAEAMISVSDNSATDLLLAELGRDRIEAMLPIVGIADPARNQPFLSTLEAFKLKLVDGGAYADRYAALDAAGRRALLAGEVAALPVARIDDAPFRAQRPTRIADIEWFASADDLVRVMDWLRRNTEANAVARAILSKNPGIAPSPQWRYIGYKGGSEPGVMNMTLLLQAADGSWYALAGSWNNPAAPVDEGRFAGLIGGIAALAGR